MTIQYHGFRDKSGVIIISEKGFYSDEIGRKYEISVHNSEFICKVLNNDFDLPKHYVGDRDLTKELASTLDLDKYRNFVQAVFIDKYKTLNTRQLCRAYLLTHHDFGDFGQFTSTTWFEPNTFIHDDPNAGEKHRELLAEAVLMNWDTSSFDVVKEYFYVNNYPCDIDFCYQFDDFEGFVKFLLCTMVRDDEQINTCKNCGKYFYPVNRTDTLYCDNVSPQDITKTCKEYGAIKTYQDNLKRNKSMGLYRKIYMQKQMLAKRNPDIKSYAKDFEDYKTRSKQWKLDVKNGIKPETEYFAWLKGQRRKDEYD